MAGKKTETAPPGKDPAAVAMVRKRWDNTTDEQRSEVARKMAEARWGKKSTKKKPSKIS